MISRNLHEILGRLITDKAFRTHVRACVVNTADALDVSSALVAAGYALDTVDTQMVHDIVNDVTGVAPGATFAERFDLMFPEKEFAV